MKYKPVIIKKDKDGDQFIIRNDDGSVFENNLRDIEVIIDQLLSEYCPINRNCIDYIEKDKASRICGHFKNLFQLDENVFSDESIFCEKSKKYHTLSVLKPLNCTVSKDSCLGCEKILDIKAIPYPEKSHSHVVCSGRSGR